MHSISVNISNYIHTGMDNFKTENLFNNGKELITIITYPLRIIEFNYTMDSIFYDHFKLHGNGYVQ